MLLYFSLANWGMVRDELNLSMIAQREQAHEDRLHPLLKFKKRVLPVAAIYGPNASGKTTVIEAIQFAKDFVLVGPRDRNDRIARQYYRLDKAYKDQPSRFSFIFAVDESVYEYSFAVNEIEVVSESLKRISVNTEKVIFNREGQNGEILGNPLKDSQYAQAYIDGWAPNKLYITNLMSQGNQALSFVYQWFANIQILTPNQVFGGFAQYSQKQSLLSQTGSAFFNHLNTGICGFSEKEIVSEPFPIPEAMKKQLQSNPSAPIPIRTTMGDLYVARWDSEKQKVRLYQINTVHKATDGSEIDFNVSTESDGTRRLMDLLPMFLALHGSNQNKQSGICFVDEIDRSLHPLLLKRVLSDYLSTLDRDFATQLIFTTHNAELIDQDILRRDEILFLEREETGDCVLSKLSDFRDEKGNTVRFDSLIHKRYLRGDFGGVPQLPFVNLFELMDAERSAQ